MQRVRAEVLGDLQPVRPLPADGVSAAIFLAIALVLAAATAWLKGILGPARLSPPQIAAVFGCLLGLLLLSAFALARDMRPGARSLRGCWIFAIALGATEAVFLALFHDYTPGRFLHWGFGCFRMGIGCAAVTALLASLGIRRGYIVARSTTGATIGALAGLAGLTALELHCPIQNIPHLAIWHAGVLVASIVIGAAAGQFSREKTKSAA
jgi:hypothetical protein